MPSWKKIIVSGSDAELNQLTATSFGGNISGSATSTGSFGRVSTGKVRASQLRLSKNDTEASDTTLTMTDFGGGNMLTIANGSRSLKFDGETIKELVDYILIIITQVCWAVSLQHLQYQV